jgi:hypothetical protein
MQQDDQQDCEDSIQDEKATMLRDAGYVVIVRTRHRSATIQPSASITVYYVQQAGVQVEVYFEDDVPGFYDDGDNFVPLTMNA